MISLNLLEPALHNTVYVQEVINTILHLMIHITRNTIVQVQRMSKGNISSYKKSTGIYISRSTVQTEINISAKTFSSSYCSLSFFLSDLPFILTGWRDIISLRNILSGKSSSKLLLLDAFTDLFIFTVGWYNVPLGNLSQRDIVVRVTIAWCFHCRACWWCLLVARGHVKITICKVGKKKVDK